MPYACKFCIAMKGLKADEVPGLPDEMTMRQHVKDVHGSPGRTARDILGPGRELAADLIERTDAVVLVGLLPTSGQSTAADRETWPISRCRGEWLDVWEFVEETQGTYAQALERARALQGSPDAEWQYRLWDCREVATHK